MPYIVVLRQISFQFVKVARSYINAENSYIISSGSLKTLETGIVGKHGSNFGSY